MKHLPLLIVGAVAAVIAFVSPALISSPGAGIPIGMLDVVIIVVFYSPVLIAIIAGAAGAFRAIWLSTQRAALATRIALGEPRRTIIWAHTRDGVRLGAIAGAVGLILGAVARQVQTGLDVLALNATALVPWALALVLAVTSLAVAYFAAARWATRGVVASAASGQPAEAATETPRPRRRRLALGITAAVFVAGAAAVIAVQLGVDHPSFVLVATILGLVAIYLALPALLVVAGVRLVGILTRAASGVLGRGATPGSGRAIAADGLASPSPMRAGAVIAVAAVMVLATGVTIWTNSNAIRNEAATALIPDATISTTNLYADAGGRFSGPSGWLARDIDNALVDRLRADDRLLVIEAGVLVTDLRITEPADGLERSVMGHDMLLAVTPDQLEQVRPDGARALYFAGNVQMAGNGPGSTYGFDGSETFIEVNGLRHRTAQLTLGAPFAGIDRDWAELHYGAAPTNALLVYAASGNGDVMRVLAEYDLTDYQVAEFGYWSDDQSRVITGSLPVFAPLFMLIAIGIVAAHAWSTQRLRLRAHATMHALGATTASLRVAASIEAALMAAIGVVLGLATGVGFGLVVSAESTGAWAVRDGDLLLWNAGLHLSHAPWAGLLTMSALAIVLAAGAGLLARASLDRLTPAVQLTEATKAGIR